MKKNFFKLRIAILFVLIVVVANLAPLKVKGNATSVTNFKVNNSTSIVAFFDTPLTFSATQVGAAACDMNLYNDSNIYVGPYPGPGRAGVNMSGATLLFTGQNGTFASSDYNNYPEGGYYFEVVCDDGSGTFLARQRVFVDLSRRATGTYQCIPPAQVALNWTALTGATYYNVQRNGWSIPVQVQTNSFTDNGTFDGALSPNTTYTYTITPIQNSVPISGATQNVVITTGATCSPPSTSPAVINVNANSCSGATWLISPGNYTTTPNSVAAGTYTLTPSWPANSTGQSVTNSDGGTNTLNIASGQTKTFSLSCNITPPPPPVPVITSFTINGSNSATITAPGSATLAWSATNNPTSCTATGGDPSWPGSKAAPSGTVSTGTISTAQTYTYYLYCSNSSGNSNTAQVTLQVNTASCTWSSWSACSKACDDGSGPGTQTSTNTCGGTQSQTCNTQSCASPTLPACSVDSFPAQSEYGGVVYPTWSTSNSNNVVLSGGQFGSGVQVEPDGQRGISISSNTLLTITANAGSTCSPSASVSAWMYAEGTPPPPPPGGACTISYFPADAENGDGWVYPQWQTDAANLVLSGGKFSNTPVAAPNGSTAMQIDVNTQLTLTGNGGSCSQSAWFYAASPPPPPPNFSAAAGSCGTGQMNLSWGISAGAGGYKLFRNGTQIMDQPVNSFRDTGLTAGATYSYEVIGTSPNGNTAPSSLTATAPASCAPPSSPTGFTATPSSCGNYWINLSWNAVSGATSYQVYRSGTLVYNGTGLAFSDTGVSGGASYTYTITATGANGVSTAVSATPSPVTAPSACVAPFDYSLSSPQAVTIQKGGVNQYGQNSVTKTLVAGNPQTVDLSVRGLPTGVSSSISNQSCAPTCTSTITYTATPTAQTGTSQVFIDGSLLSKSTWFYLTINPSTAVVVSCSASPSVGAKIGNTVVWSANASGGSGTGYTYTWNGTGVPGTGASGPGANQYSIVYTTTGAKTMQATVTDSLGNTGTCPSASAIISFDPKFQEF